MTLTVRDYHSDDAKGVSEVERSVYPLPDTTPEIVEWKASTRIDLTRFRWFVAESDGHIVGVARVLLAHDTDKPGQIFVNVGVHPRQRGRGVGTGLAEVAEQYAHELGARAMHTFVRDEDASLTFAERRGYQPSRINYTLSVNLDAANLPSRTLDAGLDLVTGAEFAADPRPLYELDSVVVADEPGDVPVEGEEYSTWRELIWDRPSLDKPLTTVVVAGGEPVAFSEAHTGDGRFFSGMTGTLPEFRGKGLATIAKGHTLRRAQSAGYTEAWTGNDSTNIAMLALNERLGYQRAVIERFCTRQLESPDDA